MWFARIFLSNMDEFNGWYAILKRDTDIYWKEKGTSSKFIIILRKILQKRSRGNEIFTGMTLGDCLFLKLEEYPFFMKEFIKLDNLRSHREYLWRLKFYSYVDKRIEVINLNVANYIIFDHHEIASLQKTLNFCSELQYILHLI